MVFVPLKNCPCALCSKNIPTVRPAENFDAEADAKALREAMRGFGCNNEEITAILPHRSANQRVNIEQVYKTLYGRDLMDDLKSELGGNFERVVIAMMFPFPSFAARAIKKACKGVGTNEQTLIDILCTANNCEIRMITDAYKQMYGDTMEELLEKELSGDFQNLMVAVIQAARHEDDPVDLVKAKEDAQAIQEAGELKYGTDESTFTRVLVRNSYQQLYAVSQAYFELAGKTLEEVCAAELGGDLLKAAETILGVAKNKDEFWAQRLHRCMAGMGTDDKALINILIARSEIDLGNIKLEFVKNYEKTLDQWIEDECSGDYKKMVLALIADS
ncbi:annexin-B12 [Folsomia candida]|uniref:Annexin n=1 Tax=Folsomia candida TaxID=158441 RepID=A0A226EIG1_FOLCA|nr:annexin-B12 [Folsomia candida]OXA57432.1 Annexin B9 [Folsomia candida]